MKRYDKYKPSGVEWIGEVPNEWEVCRLKNYCSLKGRIGWNGLRSDEFKDVAYAYLVTGQDFEGDIIPWDRCYQIDKERYEEDPFIQLKNGDLLITKDGTIGKIAKVSNLDKPACLNSGIFVMKQTKNKYSQDYLFWLLKSNLLSDFNDFTSSGTTILHLYQNVFENMPMLVPPLPEQTAIANYLDAKCAKIDNVVSVQQKRIELLKELKQSIITHAVTKGLDKKAKMKPSGVEWIGEVPEKWEVKRLKFIINSYKAGPFGSSLITSQLLKDGNILVYTPEHIANQSVDIDNNLYLPQERKEEMMQFFVKQGDIIFPIVGTLGRAMQITNDMPNGIINQRLARFRLNEGIDNTYFMWVFARCKLFKSFFDVNSRGSIIINLTKEIVGNLPIAIPPIEEQITIAAYLDKKCATIDKQIGKVERQIELLKEYKQSVITECVTGKRKVC